MEGTRFFGIYNVTFMQEVMVAKLYMHTIRLRNRNIISQRMFEDDSEWQYEAHLVAEEAARDVDLLASNNGNLLTREDLFCNNACKTT